MSQTGLHVVHIVEGFAGGISTYLRLVLPQLAQQDVALTLIYSAKRNCPSMPHTLAILRRHGITVRNLPMTRSIHPLADLVALLRLTLILWQGRFDIVHTHGSKAGALGRLAGWFAGIDLRLHTPHCFAHLRSRAVFSRCLYLNLERCLGKITTHLLAVSPSEAAVAINRNMIAADKCTVVPNALPVRKSQTLLLKKSLGLEQYSFIVTTVTRADSAKGLQRFLDLAAIWPHPKTVFLIAGDCQPSNDKSSNVRWLGFCYDMEPIYALSDVIVLASDAEGQSYVLLEAMRSGCAVLATRVPGNEDLIDHGQTGLLADVNPISLAQNLHQLRGDPVLRRRLGSNAHHYINRHHTLDHQTHRLTDTYNIIKGSNKTTASKTWIPAFAGMTKPKTSFVRVPKSTQKQRDPCR